MHNKYRAKVPIHQNYKSHNCNIVTTTSILINGCRYIEKYTHVFAVFPIDYKLYEEEVMLKYQVSVQTLHLIN